MPKHINMWSTILDEQNTRLKQQKDNETMLKNKFKKVSVRKLTTLDKQKAMGSMLPKNFMRKLSERSMASQQMGVAIV